MIKKNMFFFILIFSIEYLFGQPNRYSIITSAGWGILIEQDGRVPDFSTFKWNIAYLIQKQDWVFRLGYSNWQSATLLRHVTQNSLEIGGGCNFFVKHGSIGGILGMNLRSVYGASPQIFNQWTLAGTGIIHGQIPITKKTHFVQELEYIYNPAYNSLAYNIGFLFHL
jgi:hypothetical protein